MDYFLLCACCLLHLFTRYSMKLFVCVHNQIFILKILVKVWKMSPCSFGFTSKWQLNGRVVVLGLEICFQWDHFYVDVCCDLVPFCKSCCSQLRPAWHETVWTVFTIFTWVFTQPPYSFAACLASSKLCLFTSSPGVTHGQRLSMVTPPALPLNSNPAGFEPSPGSRHAT